MTKIAFNHKIHKRAKRLTLRVEPDGSVIVTTPKRTSEQAILKFVEKHRNWIVVQQQKYQKIPKPVTVNFVQLFGKQYNKILQYSKELPVGVKVHGSTLTLNPTDYKTADWGDSENKLLNGYLKATAQRYIVPRTKQFSNRMSLSFKNISLKEQKSRWGSCSSKGNLNFNWRLVHYETTIIDYVIIHELAHLKHMNHSKSFWDLVQQHDPEYRKHRGFLKRQGLTVG